MSLLLPGVAIIRNEEEEVVRRKAPRGAHAAIFRNALKCFAACRGWPDVCHMCVQHDCMCVCV